MRKLIAICFKGPDTHFAVTFPDLLECIAFVESLAPVRAAAAEIACHREEARESIRGAIPKPSIFDTVARERSLRRKSRQRRRHRLRLLFRRT
jgi:predicted RNase H-like HicB family nuclease